MTSQVCSLRRVGDAAGQVLDFLGLPKAGGAAQAGPHPQGREEQRGRSSGRLGALSTPTPGVGWGRNTGLPARQRGWPSLAWGHRKGSVLSPIRGQGEVPSPEVTGLARPSWVGKQKESTPSCSPSGTRLGVVRAARSYGRAGSPEVGPPWFPLKQTSPAWGPPH